jgi:septum formation inhibitor-activating ATPase MinD
MHMAQVVVVTSGKGGVGKTTSTAALGAALARAGERVAVIDFDVGLRNLDLVMGAERRVVFDLIHVVQGTAKLSQALIRDKRIDTLFLLAASQTRDKDSLSDEGVERVIRELRPSFDGSFAIVRPASSEEPRLPCGTRISPWWSPILRCPRSAIPIESSACSIRRQTRPNVASHWTNTCS